MRSVDPERFNLAAEAFGFDAAVLVDAKGRALNIVPPQRELIGTRVAASYPHLLSALHRGRPTVSNVVLSEARALPIVAVAVPFETRFGRRVFSGGAQLDRSPLAAFLNDALPYRGARAYLIDAEGFVMVAGGTRAAVLAAPPDTAGATGSVVVAGAARTASLPRRSRARPGASSPSLRHTSSSPRSRAGSTGFPGSRSPRSHWRRRRRSAAEQAAEPEEEARRPRDARSAHRRAEPPHPRTRVPSHVRRGGASDCGRRTRRRSRPLQERQRQHGHAAGDELLRRVAETLRLAVRPSDVVARIGGDEFVVLLAEVGEDQARDIARRVDQAFESSRFCIADGVEIAARCSVGVAIAGEDDVIDAVLARADRALYRSKDAGRTLSTASSAL